MVAIDEGRIDWIFSCIENFQYLFQAPAFYLVFSQANTYTEIILGY